MPTSSRSVLRQLKRSLEEREKKTVTESSKGRPPTLWLSERMEKTPEELEQHAKSAHSQLIKNRNAVFEQAKEIGRDLIAIKEIVGHGNYKKWVAEHFDFGKTTIQQYFKIAEWWDRLEPLIGEQIQSLKDAYDLAREWEENPDYQPGEANEEEELPGEDEEESDAVPFAPSMFNLLQLPQIPVTDEQRQKWEERIQSAISEGKATCERDAIYFYVTGEELVNEN